jgi:hypothetical protein
MPFIKTRIVGAFAAAILASLLAVSTAMGHECINASKVNAGAGAQLVIGVDGSIVSMTPGLAHRLEQGLIDPETGEGFHGLIGFDYDGDGVADMTTWLVGPNDEIPVQAQEGGPDCRGVTNVETYFTKCLGG